MSRAKTQERTSHKPADGIDGYDDLDAAREAAEAMIGRVIDGRYAILDLIGQGGMGSVYKAQHTGLRRTVALKLLHPGLARVPEVSKRFKREAQAIGRIEHPNCVRVTDFGQLEDASLYLVMEYLEGRSLGDVLADEFRIEITRTLRILQHVLRGLGHAHKSDIIHRDVKPENVLLVPQPSDPDFAKILDFGIAKMIGSAARDSSSGKLTQAGMAFGTPVYMSPEQAVGNPIDGRADLYAATVMAYEMITGLPPFNSEDKLEVMTMHTAKPVPPMREMAPDIAVPPQVEQLLLRGLAKRPDDRYSSADEYVAAIDMVLAQLHYDTAEHELRRRMMMSPPGALTPPPGEQIALDQRSLVHTSSTAYPPNIGHTSNRVPTRAGTHEPGQTSEVKLTRARALAIVGGVVLVAVLIAVIIAGGDAQNTLTERAAERLGQGDPQGAIAVLEEDSDTLAKDPAAQLVLGHSFSALRSNEKAIAAYRAALTLDPERRSDEKLRVNLEVMLDDRVGEAAVTAFELWAEHYRDDEADAKLIGLAMTQKNNAVRSKVVEEVRRRNIDERVDWVASYVLDLIHGQECEDRKQAVSRLRATGDKRAIPHLKKAANRRVKRKKKWRPINRCLREDALEAVQYLESLTESAGSTSDGADADPS